MKKRLVKVYNIAIVVLALVSVAMAFSDLLEAPIASQPFFYPLDTAILIVFAIDYLVRFILSKEKWTFFKHNIFDLIAIIPFSSIFALFRTLRILRIARLAKLAKLSKVARLVGVGGRLKARANEFLHMNGLIYIIYLNMASVLIGAVAIYLLEKGATVNTFSDALWWAFVTAATVGYGDISPSTTGGRLVAIVLMIVGIGLVSMLTGTIATYFTSKATRNGRQVKIDELKEAAADLNADQLDALIEQAKQIGGVENGKA